MGVLLQPQRAHGPHPSGWLRGDLSQLQSSRGYLLCLTRGDLVCCVSCQVSTSLFWSSSSTWKGWLGRGLTLSLPPVRCTQSQWCTPLMSCPLPQQLSLHPLLTMLCCRHHCQRCAAHQGGVKFVVGFVEPPRGGVATRDHPEQCLAAIQ